MTQIATNGVTDFALANHCTSSARFGEWLYVAYRGDQGYWLTRIHDDGTQEPAVLIAYIGDPSDLHYHVALTIDQLGFVHVFYDGHSTPMYHRRQLAAESISSGWTVPVEFANGTYCHPYVVDHATQAAGRICAIHRRNDGTSRDLYVTWSNDQGATWNANGKRVGPDMIDCRMYAQRIHVEGNICRVITSRTNVNTQDGGHHKIGLATSDTTGIVFTHEWIDGHQTVPEGWLNNIEEARGLVRVDGNTYVLSWTNANGAQIRADGVVIENGIESPWDTITTAQPVGPDLFSQDANGNWDAISLPGSFWHQHNGPLIITDKWRVFGSRLDAQTGEGVVDVIESVDGAAWSSPVEFFRCAAPLYGRVQMQPGPECLLISAGNEVHYFDLRADEPAPPVDNWATMTVEQRLDDLNDRLKVLEA